MVPQQPLINLENINLSFEGTANLFQNLNLRIFENSFYFLTGASGSGKSTLLRMLHMDQYPDSGHMHIFQKNVRQLTNNQCAVLRRKIGVVYQDFRLIPHLTALENVSLPLKIKGIHDRKREKEAIELLAWVGLENCLHRRPAELSGGQQQRVAIARAVISHPRLLLADEPTGNVDDQVAVRLLYLFEELYKAGTTVIVATHNNTLADAFPYPEIQLVNGTIRQKNKPHKSGGTHV